MSEHDADPSRELAMVAFELGQGDTAREQRMYAAYVAAGGPGRVTSRTDLGMTVAQLHSLSQRQLLGMYLDHLRERLVKVNPEMNNPDVQAWSQAKAEAMFAEMKRRGCRVGEGVATLAPHRSGRADFPHPVPHARDSFQLV